MQYGEFSRIYDKLINEDVDYDKIACRINQIKEKYKCENKDYLDLACGTGNVSIKLSEKFDTTYAVDISEDMLAYTFDKFDSVNRKCNIYCQDISELSLDHKFDLITCVLDSTNYIIETEALYSYFKGVYNHLKYNGIFIFDINSYYKITNILGNNTYVYSTDDLFYSWENFLENDTVEMYLTFFVKEGTMYQRFEEEHIERAYKEQEIEEALAASGLKVLEKYDGYSKSEVAENSERIMYVVKKGEK